MVNTVSLFFIILKEINMEEIITISLEEYRELLIIKGKYEELKSIYYGPYSSTKITYRDYSNEGSQEKRMILTEDDFEVSKV